ncbi:hypothetical protein ACU80C_11865 [Bacillus mycoides]|uniref:hypothetical protein n=1 Tax=Bacillus mycoides TaxID=1405 RepID=UPI00065BBE79|nr:hypothetical protein [Bacillus mycoides]KMQ17879.1 hypothetical protein TU70_10825 [Bacillus mycoides]QWH97184.1 hypothetical protein EXW36_11640 [Bacillus mycoides]
MIVNKPQFDENELKEGTAIQVTASQKYGYNRSNKNNWNAIVVEFSPLMLSVAGYNADEHDRVETMNITIEQIVKKSVTIEKLVVAIPKDGGLNL